MRSAIRVTSPGVSISQITANSSPPSRATMLDRRTMPLRRAATACRKISPALWPSVSLISLNRSRSMNRSAKRPWVVCDRVMASSSAREAHTARQPGELIALGQPKRTFSRRHQFTRPLLHPLLKVGRKLGELLVQVIQFPRLRLEHRLGFAACAPFAIKAAFETKAALVDALGLSRGAHAARSIVNRTKPPVADSWRVRQTAIGSPK